MFLCSCVPSVASVSLRRRALLSKKISYSVTLSLKYVLMFFCQKINPVLCLKQEYYQV